MATTIMAWHPLILINMSAKTGGNYNCLTCKKEFYMPLWKVREGRRFCSLGCRPKRTPEQLLKMSLSKKGKPAWNKGKTKLDDPRLVFHRPTTFKSQGKSSESELARKSIEYRQWRNLVFERDDFTCQICCKRGGELNADHIKPFCLFKEERYNVNNGRTLCLECHRNTPTYGRKALNFGTNYWGVASTNFN